MYYWAEAAGIWFHLHEVQKQAIQGMVGKGRGDWRGTQGSIWGAGYAGVSTSGKVLSCALSIRVLFCTLRYTSVKKLT